MRFCFRCRYDTVGLHLLQPSPPPSPPPPPVPPPNNPAPGPCNTHAYAKVLQAGPQAKKTTPTNQQATPTSATTSTTATGGGGAGYSEVTPRQQRKKSSEDKLPFPSHGYSSLNRSSKLQRKSLPVTAAPTNDGYSTVTLTPPTQRGMAVSGGREGVAVAKEVEPPSEGVRKEGVVTAGSGKERDQLQLSSIMESIESRFKSFQDTQQSAEMTKYV